MKINKHINKVAVIGSGIMGSQIACHFANIGVEVLLLDIIPADLTEREIKEFLVERYGEYILFKPLINYKNLFLWTFPFILLAISLIFFTYRLRKK